MRKPFPIHTLPFSQNVQKAYAAREIFSYHIAIIYWKTLIYWHCSNYWYHHSSQIQNLFCEKTPRLVMKLERQLVSQSEKVSSETIQYRPKIIFYMKPLRITLSQHCLAQKMFRWHRSVFHFPGYSKSLEQNWIKVAFFGLLHFSNCGTKDWMNIAMKKACHITLACASVKGN